MPNSRSKTKRVEEAIEDSEIESRFEQARSEFYNIAANLAEMGSAKAREFTDMAANAASGIKDDVTAVSGDALDQLMSQLTALERDMENSVRRKPLQALAIAGGIGFLIALFTRR